MKIKEIVSQNRRDFKAIYECESCGEVTAPSYGYDDRNFHENVIPAMRCPKCGAKAPDNYRPMATKYPDGMNI